jgi:serine/threonine protein phosphatase PrpC
MNLPILYPYIKLNFFVKRIYKTYDNMTHRVSLTEHIQQMDKHQDQTYLGEGIYAPTGEEFKFAMVTDGHGRNDCITILRNISPPDLSQMLGQENPVQVLADYVNKKQGELYAKKIGTGATMCLTRIFQDRIECINSGDSQFAVYKDGALLHLSKEHNWENDEDRDRILATDPRIFFEPSRSMRLVSDKKIVSCYSEYVAWPDSSRLACTQALGHGSRTGYAPECIVIPLEKGIKYKVLIGSDGVWDMVMKNDPVDVGRFATMEGKDILEFISARWLQEWETTNKVQRYDRDECDDISLVVADVLPI